MTICNKDGTLTAKARKKNGRLFVGWISGTGRHHAEDTLELLSPSDEMKLVLSRRPISDDDDTCFITRTNATPDGGGETIFFGLLRYTARNITEVGFSKAGGGPNLMSISKWQEMDGGLRFAPGKRTIDADELLSEIGRALYRMSPGGLLEAPGLADDNKFWTSTFSPTELVKRIRDDSTEELRCARMYKLIVSLFFLGDADRSRADHFYRMVAASITSANVDYADVCERFLSHYPLELQESQRLANEMVKADASLPIVAVPVLPPQGTNAPLVATQELLAEKFLESEASARANKEFISTPRPPGSQPDSTPEPVAEVPEPSPVPVPEPPSTPIPEPPAAKIPDAPVPLEGITLPPASIFMGGTTGQVTPARLVPARIPSRWDVLELVRSAKAPAQPLPAAPVAAPAPHHNIPPARPVLRVVKTIGGFEGIMEVPARKSNHQTQSSSRAAR